MAAGFVLASVVDNIQKQLILEILKPVKELLSNLEISQCLLLDADEKQEMKGEVLKVAESVTELCYDVENVLERFAFRASSSSSSATMFLRKHYLCLPCDHISTYFLDRKIAGFTEKLVELNRRLGGLGIKERKKEEVCASGAIQNLPRRGGAALLNEETPVVRLHDEEKKLLEILMASDDDGDGDDKRSRPTVAILGCRGSGKTTLALQLLEHPQTKARFRRVAIVVVGGLHRTRSVLQDTLQQLLPPESDCEELMGYDYLKLFQKLSHVLKSGRYLVLLDEVCSVEAWESLRMAFAYGEMESKVIVTTRSEEVANRVAERGCVHRIRRLTDDESRRLLRSGNSSFLKGPDGDRSIENVCNSLVQQCGGLPLALVMLADYLSTKSAASEWEKLHKKTEELNKVHSELDQVLMAIFSLSYDDLPHYLKPVFLYLGHFQDGSWIEVEKLCLLMIAEGIISPEIREEHRVTDLIKKTALYLEDLAVRGMVDVEEDEVSELWKFKFCRLNSRMRAMCLEKVEETKFFNVMYSSDKSFSVQKVRRLGVYLDKYETKGIGQLFMNQEIARRVRSLMFLNECQQEELMRWPRKKKILSLREFRCLKVLNFDGYMFHLKPPAGVEKLGLLRYLSFKGCYLMELPSYICKLRNLQTLDLRVAASCKMSIPNVLWKMERLKHLYLPDSYQPRSGDRDKKLEFSGMKSLEILVNFDTSLCRAQDLAELTNVRILSANIKGNSEDLWAVIDHLKNPPGCTKESYIYIRSFDCVSERRRRALNEVFSCGGIVRLFLQGRIAKPPLMVDPFSPIVLSFDNSELDQDGISTLEKLPKLRILVLHNDAYVGKTLTLSASGFPELRRLKLSTLHKLKTLSIPPGAMPKLTSLVIKNCKKLEAAGLDEGLRDHIMLDIVPIEMPDEFHKECETMFGKDVRFFTRSHSKSAHQALTATKKLHFVKGQMNSGCASQTKFTGETLFEVSTDCAYQPRKV